MNWHFLTSEKQLEEINQMSFNPRLVGVLLFKHSTRCSISEMALRRLERNWRFSDETFPTYYLDLLIHRPLSLKIAELFTVEHESPQVLIIKNGRCIYTASHSNIQVDDIGAALLDQ